MNISENNALWLIADIWHKAKCAIEADPLDAATIGTQSVDMLEGIIKLLCVANERPDRAIASAAVAQARIQSLMTQAERPRITTHRATTGAGILR